MPRPFTGAFQSRAVYNSTLPSGPENISSLYSALATPVVNMARKAVRDIVRDKLFKMFKSSEDRNLRAYFSSVFVNFHVRFPRSFTRCQNCRLFGDSGRALQTASRASAEVASYANTPSDS